MSISVEDYVVDSTALQLDDIQARLYDDYAWPRERSWPETVVAGISPMQPTRFIATPHKWDTHTPGKCPFDCVPCAVADTFYKAVAEKVKAAGRPGLNAIDVGLIDKLARVERFTGAALYPKNRTVNMAPCTLVVDVGGGTLVRVELVKNKVRSISEVNTMPV